MTGAGRYEFHAVHDRAEKRRRHQSIPDNARPIRDRSAIAMNILISSIC